MPAPLEMSPGGVWALAPVSGAHGGLAAVVNPGGGTLVVVASFSTGGKPPSRVVRGGTSPPITPLLTDAGRPSPHAECMERSAASQRNIAGSETGSRS
jgi:hypothetical protein